MYILLIIALPIFIIYKYSTWTFNYWKNRNIPCVEPSFFYGSLKEVITGQKHFGVVIRDWYRKFPDVPYFGYFKTREPAIVIRDPELIKKILIKDFAHFNHNDFHVNPHNDPIMVQNLFGQRGEEWKKFRNAWSGSLTLNKVKAMYDNIKLKYDNLAKHIDEHIGEPIEARRLGALHFTDIITSSILKVEKDSFKDKNNPYIDIITSFFLPTFIDGIKTYVFMFVPWLGELLKLGFVKKKTEKQLLDAGKEVLEVRKRVGLEKINPFDTVLENGYSKGSEGYSSMDAAGIIFGFLLDGTETASAVFSFLMHSIAANSHIQEKLRTEVDEAFEAHGGKLDFDTIQELPYLELIWTETVRLYNPVSIMQKVCTKPYVLPPINNKAKPYTIPEGMTIIIPRYAIHTDPQYFNDPETFDPERFAPENKESIPKDLFFPFSEGPRQCIGFRFGRGENKITVAHLIRDYEIRLAPRTAGKPLEVDPNVFVLKCKDNIWLTFHKRSK